MEATINGTFIPAIEVLVAKTGDTQEYTGPVCVACKEPIPAWPTVSVCESCGQQN